MSSDLASGSNPAARVRGRWLVAAAVWGAAEAAVFFIVPDVLTSFRAIHRLRDGLAACAAALAGALAGGLLLFAFARAEPAHARAMVDAVPGVPAAWIDSAQADLEQRGLSALFVGAISGRPYKVFVLAAAAHGTSPWTLVAVSAAARLARFVAVTLLAWAIARALRRPCSLVTLRRIHLVAWAAFYAWYFTRVAR